MYVVTSIPLVSRARATLRNAELGFLGVCVYTRMHTPRFSGHPCSAGDLVLVRTFSRPRRTNCANVGKALPQTSCTFAFPRACARRAADLPTDKGQLQRPGWTDKTPQTYSSSLTRLSWVRLERLYSALRGWRPIPAAPLAPFTVLLCSGTGEPPLHTAGSKSPNKLLSIGKSRGFVKIKYRIGRVENFSAGPRPAGRPSIHTLSDALSWSCPSPYFSSKISFSFVADRSSIF